MLVKHEGKDVKLPDFLIVGAAKSGTTSLHYYLKQHPQIFMPKVKELWFFSFMDNIPNIRHGHLAKMIVSKFDQYINYFQDANSSQIIGEACPGYLYTYESTIANIKKTYKEKYKDLKIIIILRNPAERAWSQFMMNRKSGEEPLDDFLEVLKPDIIRKRLNDGWSIGFDYVGFGMYCEQVRAFIKDFPETRIFLYDEFSWDSLKVVREIFTFIGVDPMFVLDTEKRHNISGKPRLVSLNRLIYGRYPLKKLLKSVIPYQVRARIRTAVDQRNIQRQEMPIALRSKLIDIYREEIIKLQDLLNKDLSSWLE